ncbi:Gle1 [Thalictrum thalictroides]|uniref:mRNA export factor GLE1 n=1 Tax=Thalictrum thalictroides TaxID=46969 RepID=A0A7J6W9W6_THATH|nr:Gle1 [Thalictrum thalictroides]
MDPKPDWSLNQLISELNSIELNSCSSSNQPLFVKTQAREFSNKKEFISRRSSKPFVMHVSDDEETDVDDDDDEENQDPNLVVGTRFACEKIYLSDSDNSEDELPIEETQASILMQPMGSIFSSLYQEEIENQKLIQENIRHDIDLLEISLINENERSTIVLTQLEKLTEARREMARKLDTQYRRKMAEALDNYLISVQRNHEQKSQLEERKLRNDAANEEAKKKEKERVFQEEKLRQEKAKEEAEAVKRKVEQAQKDALEAARRTKEAAEKKASETKNVLSAKVSNEKQDTGIKIRASERALMLEEGKAQKYNELIEKNREMKSIKDFRQYELQIGRHLRQITGTREIIRTKANELIKIINDPLCPQSISMATFAKKVVSNCESSGANFDGTAFACGQVIVQVTSKLAAPHPVHIALRRLI